MNYSVLEQKILKTVCYFDLFNFPLTNWEIWRFLYTAKNETLAESNSALTNLIQIKALDNQQGFYFLPGRQEISSIRKERYLIAQKKMRWALAYAKMIAKLPFVEAIFICNSLSYLNSKPESDIDFAIIARAGHIWTCRFFCASLMALLRRRPTKKTQKNRLCLSFFVSSEDLNLETVTYPEDIHFTYWLRQFLPIYDPKNWNKQLDQNNKWLANYIPNFEPTITNSRWMIKSRSLISWLLEKVFYFRFWETLFKWGQLKIMPKRLKELAKTQNKNVVFSNTLLKFHDKDNRQEIQKQWLDKYQKICQN